MQIKIKSFEDLDSWKIGHAFVIETYKQTNCFPKEEMFGLVSQMRRSAVSITSNIAEGFSRQSSKEKIQFYSIALGSITEIQNQIIISKDIEYIKIDDYNKLKFDTIRLHKMINGLIRYLKLK